MARENGHVVLALFDFVDGEIDHIVMYQSEEGLLTSVVASSDFGPFDDYVAKLQWLLRTLRAHGAASRR
jgi:hypothetical protein